MSFLSAKVFRAKILLKKRLSKSEISYPVENKYNFQTALNFMTPIKFQALFVALTLVLQLAML